MDSSLAAAPTPPARRSAWALALLGAALVGYAAFLAFHVGAYAGQSDSSGYLNSARLLAHGQTAVAQRIPAGIDPAALDSYTFIPLGFRPASAVAMAPTYPIGLPLALAALGPLMTWALAPHFLMVASALAAAVLMFPLGRAAGLPRSWSVFGSLLFAASPLTTFMSLQLMSDVPATAAASAAILCAWRSRTHRAWGPVAGAVFSAAVLIRPNNLILLAPLALCLGLDSRRWLGFILGGLPGAAGQMAYNHAAYGHAFASGYGGDLASKFTLGIAPVTLAHYARWLPVLLTPVGLAAIALPWIGRRQPFAWVLTTWIAVTLAFYTPYFHTHETWWYLRFLLPAFPAAFVGGLWIVHHFWSRLNLPRLRPLVTRSLALAATLVVLGRSVVWHQRLNATHIGHGESVYPEACQWAKTHLPPDALVVTQQTSGAFFYYTDFPLVRWDTLKPERFARLAAAVGPRPLFAVLFPHEVTDALKLNSTGLWTQIGAVRQVTIWQWAPTAP